LLKDQTEEGPCSAVGRELRLRNERRAFRALETVALTARDYRQRAVAWLRPVQNPTAASGESIASYYDPALKGQGASTASQTAWGLIDCLRPPRSRILQSRER
jgi:squalene cyclase